MASGERVLKLSSEAFSRLKNDHEQFLEGYEKPTQIYRFLHARRTLKPLFMHRNLSYMQNRQRRRKKRHRIRISDLLKYRRQREIEGADLASQIKSDNFLMIKFHQLEKGIDFSHLLSAALAGGVESAPPTCHAPSLMEVEVLLYHHTSEATSCRGNGISLGKFEVEYTPNKNGGEKMVSGRAVPGSGGCGHTLSVPESKLVWSGSERNRGAGSRMLVFRATARAGRGGGGGGGRCGERPSLHKSLANVSVEVNRINHSDIVQLTSKTKQPATVQQSPTTDGDNGSSSKRETGNSAEQDSRECDATIQEPMDTHSERDSGDFGLGEAAKNVTKTSRKSSRSRPKERRIMTDLSLGACCTTAKMQASSSTARCKHSLACNRPSHQGLPEDGAASGDASFPRKGFTENGTSIIAKLARRRNGLNGLSLLNGHLDDHQSKELTPNHSRCDEKATGLDQSAEYSLTVSIPCSTYNGGTPPRPSLSSADNDHHHNHHHHHHHWTNHDCKQTTTTTDAGIPVVTAEDTSTNGTPSQGIAEGSLAQSGTANHHKSTPVESPIVSPVAKMVVGGGGGGTKRSLDESGSPLPPEVGSPPLKMARIGKQEDESPDDVCMTDGEEKMRVDYCDTTKSDDKIEPESTMSPPPPPAPRPPPPSLKEDAAATHETLNKDSLEVPPVTGTGITTPEGLFCAEMVVFDSRGECLLDEGEYSILMQKCPRRDGESCSGEAPPTPPPPLLTFSPLSWNSVFGEGAEKGKVEESENMMLKFSLSWSRGPPQHRLISELETALDLQRLRNDYFAPTPPPSTAPASHTTSPTPVEAPVSSLANNHSTTTSPNNIEPSWSVLQPSSAGSAFHDRTDSTRASSSSAAAVVRGTVEREGSVVERRGEEDRAAESVEGRAGVPVRMEGRPTLPQVQKALQSNASLSREGSKEDADEYFTATEASASSSVADSTELAQCRGSLPPSASLSGPSSSTPQPREGDKVIFNFLYNSDSLQQTESRGDLRCPWCLLICRQLYSLLKHMSLCHPRFLFTYTPVEGGSVIDVHLNKLYEAGQGSMGRDPVERSGMSLRQRWKGPLKCLPCTAILVERHEGVEEDLSEFLNDGSWKRGYNVKRQYYHSHTCLPMLSEEMAADSEAELESIGRWQRTCSQRMIDEFTDVNKGEKELMKMWNLFAMEQGMTAYKQVPSACVKFTQEKGPEIVEKNIVNSFLAHLTSLCDFSLISPSTIQNCVEIVHMVAQPLS